MQHLHYLGRKRNNRRYVTTTCRPDQGYKSHPGVRFTDKTELKRLFHVRSALRGVSFYSLNNFVGKSSFFVKGNLKFI